MSGDPTGIAIGHFHAQMEEMQALAFRRANPAGFMRERIVQLVREFQASLGDDSETGILVQSHGTPIHLRAISHSDPDILIFDGLDNGGKEVRLVQHHSQLTITLVNLPKIEAVAYRIGFI